MCIRDSHGPEYEGTYGAHIEACQYPDQHISHNPYNPLCHDASLEADTETDGEHEVAHCRLQQMQEDMDSMRRSLNQLALLQS